MSNSIRNILSKCKRGPSLGVAAYLVATIGVVVIVQTGGLVSYEPVLFLFSGFVFTPALAVLYWRLNSLARMKSRITLTNDDGVTALENVLESLNNHYKFLEDRLKDQEAFASETATIKEKTNESLRKVAGSITSLSERISQTESRVAALNVVTERQQAQIDDYRSGFDARRIREFHHEIFRLWDKAVREKSPLNSEIEDLLGNHGVSVMPDEFLAGQDQAKYAEIERVEPDETHAEGCRQILRTGFIAHTGVEVRVLRPAMLRIYETSNNKSESGSTGQA